jgi:hypothetical protein
VSTVEPDRIEAKLDKLESLLAVAVAGLVADLSPVPRPRVPAGWSLEPRSADRRVPREDDPQAG